MRTGRVLVTGASGLLGTAIAERLLRDRPLWLLSNATVLPGTDPIDLMTPEGMAAVRTGEWDALVHCAAFRSPDFCEKHRAEALYLNARVPGSLAELAAARGARMIHISTDYVFDGTSPPYREDDPRAPVNHYGETKMLAEDAVREACPGAVILRVPALYGQPPAPIRSALVEEGVASALSEAPCVADNAIARFPTHTADVAEIVAFLLRCEATGILHASAPEKATRYEWALAVADQLGRPTAHITPSERDPDRKARRPVNTQLCTDRLASLGGPIPVGYSRRLPGVLALRLGKCGCSEGRATGF